ncbi:MAG TPA: CHAD domain-containing protein [Nitrospirales bacterium]|nr:CHAD domain-containing protein [Nitrospirales bacterium]
MAMSRRNSTIAASIADRAEACRADVLSALSALADGGIEPERVHAVRIGLRRLQAYFELVGDARRAALMAQCVSRLSRLRTLHVFEAYLKRRNAPTADRRAVRKRLKKNAAKLLQRETFRKLERRVRREGALPHGVTDATISEHLQQNRLAQAEALEERLEQALARPSRKALHALRLLIKTARYQEEWASDDQRRPALLDRLKRAQTILGRYEERAEFRKLTDRLELRAAKRIRKDWRRARRQARVVPQELHRILDQLIHEPRHASIVQLRR